MGEVKLREYGPFKCREAGAGSARGEGKGEGSTQMELARRNEGVQNPRNWYKSNPSGLGDNMTVSGTVLGLQGLHSPGRTQLPPGRQGQRLLPAIPEPWSKQGLGCLGSPVLLTYTQGH